ncbi:hypothetical protein ACT3UD_18615, partial [Glutamicibacter sp. 287]|uniref:hypothetical protein n=1 Tax=Glutamicibacter sp. 287 TaxID=3457732 RepID=UPI00403364A5
LAESLAEFVVCSLSVLRAGSARLAASSGSEALAATWWPTSALDSKPLAQLVLASQALQLAPQTLAKRQW